jgi:hypothetical protein
MNEADDGVPLPVGRFYTFFKPDGLQVAEASETGDRLHASEENNLRVTGEPTQKGVRMKIAYQNRAI